MTKKAAKDIIYDEKFYRRQQDGSYASAKCVVPIVISLFERIDSVIDFGCGMGTWLAVFQEMGVEHVTGVDGHHVDRSLLFISPDDFVPYDLSKSIEMKKKYDLAISLEVAEHLPKSSSQVFVDSLCAHSDTVLFSAAIPRQGGTNHVNEEYPSYWAALFKTNGYLPIDCLRHRIWKDDNIKAFYRQNILIYAKETSSFYRRNASFYYNDPLDIVHPKIYDIQRPPNSLRSLLEMLLYLLKKLPIYTMRALKRRLTKHN